MPKLLTAAGRRFGTTRKHTQPNPFSAYSPISGRYRFFSPIRDLFYLLTDAILSRTSTHFGNHIGVPASVEYHCVYCIASPYVSECGCKVLFGDAGILPRSDSCGAGYLLLHDGTNRYVIVMPVQYQDADLTGILWELHRRI